MEIRNQSIVGFDETVQLRPEGLFFIVRDAFPLKGKDEEICGTYKWIVPAFPYPFLMCPLDIDGHPFCGGVHKNHEISQFLLFEGAYPFKERVSRDNPVLLKVFGGKISTDKEGFYRNQLYLEVKAKSNEAFCPSLAIHKVLEKLGALNKELGMPKQLIIDPERLQRLEPYDMQERKKEVCIY